MRRMKQWLPATALAVLAASCEQPRMPAVAPGPAPWMDSARYTALAARLRDAFVLHDSAFCDSVLPLFDDSTLARQQPKWVTDGFISNLLTHQAPQPATWKRFNELAALTGAPVMRNWRDYVAARELQEQGRRQQAIAALEPLLARFQDDRDTVGSASVSKRLGNLYLELGEPEIAAKHLLRARALEPRVDLRAVITATLGRCYALADQADSVRWCAALLHADGADSLNARRGDGRAAINALWLMHLAELLAPGPDSLRKALHDAERVDSAIRAGTTPAPYLVASDPAAQLETTVLRARALLRTGHPRQAIAVLLPTDTLWGHGAECLPQRLERLSVLADACSAKGDLAQALHYQKARAELMALNEAGRERLAVEQALAAALRVQQETEAQAVLDRQRAETRAMDTEHRMQRVMLTTMIGFIILFAAVLFIRTRTNRRMQVEQLRMRLSRDLHDDIGSTLSSINILSTLARHKAEAGDEAGAAASLSGISERTQRLMRNMSDIVWSVDPDQDTMEDLLVRMREFGAAVLEPKGITYHFSSTGDFNASMPPTVKSNLYLIFKEAVNNAAKHAQATCVEVAVQKEKHVLHLSIADDGTGLSASAPATGGGGNGLRNMRKRAQEMDAELRVESAPGQGTSILLTAPL
jgi:signal transduction histidine kinase